MIILFDEILDQSGCFVVEGGDVFVCYILLFLICLLVCLFVVVAFIFFFGETISHLAALFHITTALAGVCTLWEYIVIHILGFRLRRFEIRVGSDTGLANNAICHKQLGQ